MSVVVVVVVVVNVNPVVDVEMPFQKAKNEEKVEKCLRQSLYKRVEMK